MIYCNGDSFTQGTELYDHIFHKDVHPGFRLPKDIFNIELRDALVKKHHFAIRKKVNTIAENAFIQNEEMKRAWPAKLEKLLNIPVMNGGKAGASMDSICNSTITDIINLKSNSEPIHLAIIQVTAIDRFDISINDHTISIMPSWLDNLSTIAYEYAKIRIENETLTSMYKNWLFNLIHLIDFFKTNDIPYLLIKSMPYFEPVGKHDELKNIESYLNLTFDFNMFDICTKLSTDVNAFCPGGHYAEAVHDGLAKEIAKIYEVSIRH